MTLTSMAYKWPVIIMMIMAAIVCLGYVVHPATWLDHQAKGLVGLGLETQCRHGPGWFFEFPNGHLRVNTHIWPTASNKPSPAWNKDESL